MREASLERLRALKAEGRDGPAPGEVADRLLESFESQIIMEDVELTLDDGCAA